MFEPKDHEELVTFLYQIPFGVARMTPDGELGMSNPKVMQLMLQMSPGSTNLLDALDAYAPDIREAVDGFEPTAGVVVRERSVDFGERGRKRPIRLRVAVTITKLAEGRLMAVLRDESAPVRASSSAA